METRDRKILQHIGVYRITLRPVLERLFFDGHSCGNVLQRLRQAGFIAGAKLSGRIGYYRLTPKGAELLELPRSRGAAFGAQAVQEHMAILWFCCMGTPRRYRVEADALAKLFPEEPPKGEHCVEEGERKRLYQIYVPGPDTPIRRIIRELRKRLHEAKTDARRSHWIDGRLYSFATLVDSRDRRSAIRTALKRTLEGDEPLIAQAYFRVEAVPGYRTVREAFAEGTGVLRSTEGEESIHKRHKTP